MCRKLIYLVSFVFVPSLVLTSVAKGVDPSLVAWWKLDDGSGTTAIDSSGNGFDITLHNTTWEDGVFGGAVHFHGVGYGDVGNFKYSDNAITVCAWVWHDVFRIGEVERYVTVGSVVAVIRKEVDGRLHFYIKTDSNLQHLRVRDVLTEGQWHHVTGTWDGLTQRLYIDGMEIASQRPGGILSNTSNVTMSSGGEPFNGMLDEVRIYNRALTQDEIQVAMQGKEWPFAFIPEPSVGAIHEDTWVKLSWFPGDSVASHDVYFGENFDDVNDGTGGTFQGSQTSTNFVVGSARSPCLITGRTYYWRIDEVNDLHPDSPWKGNVWSFWIPPKTAYDPYPVDDIDFIDPNVTLSWEPGFGAKLHTVYFGDDFANVNDADTSDTTGIYRGVQAATTYTPGPLGLDRPYYWRVDELVGSARSRETHKGAVWSFTTARSGTGTIEREVFVRVIGPEEIVFDWTTDRCEEYDLPDLPARAFRDADGKVQLILPHFVNRRMIGNTLDSVQHDCNIIMNSDHDSDPSKFNDREWVNSLYTVNGETIYALVHNEYHGNWHPGRCPSGDHKKCWHNAITFAKSIDKGRTYSHAPAPDHLVASAPYPYEPDTGPWGIFNASNIVHNANSGYYYALVRAEQRFLQDSGTSLMRTKTLGDPKSWRAWDGKEFSVRFINPYREPNADPAQHVCQPVSHAEIVKMRESLTFNTYLNKFLLVGSSRLWDPEREKLIPGFYYSLSDDIIHWTPRKLIMEARYQTEFDWPGDVLKYPSLIDPNDTSRNFEVTGQRPYLYYTRKHQGLDRDLVRVPIEFSYSPPPVPPSPPPLPSLSEALDTSLSFTTGGSAGWFSQSTTSHYDGDAAQSGDISDDQESWMQTTVSGKGTLSFYWKVSSERYCDFLEFYIDGSLQEKISGSVDWQQMMYTISTSGSHVLEWRYVKDYVVKSGSDCGWVDKVEWVITP